MDNTAQWYIDGRWVHPHEAEAAISINDTAILRAYSVFESLRTYDRRPFHLDDHLARLYRSAELIDLDIPYTREQIAAVVREVIARNAYKHATIRIFVTGGETEDSILPTGKPVLVVLITPLGERDMQRFANGVKVITTHLQRIMPEAKTNMSHATSCSILRVTVSPSRSGQYSLTNWHRPTKRSLPPRRKRFSPSYRLTTWLSAMANLAHAPLSWNSALLTWWNEATFKITPP